MNNENVARMSQQEKFDKINSDLSCFYDYCKKEGISDEEMDSICRPLVEVVKKATIKRWLMISFWVVLIPAFFVYMVSQYDVLQWHVVAVGRILLINLFPVTRLGWTSLYHNQCLIDRSNVEVVDSGISMADCVSCETVRSIARLSDTSYNEVFNQHLIRGAPVIVTDAHYDWAPRAELNLTNFINNDNRLRDSVPCRMLTNIRIGRQPTDLEEIVSRITNTDIPSWFVHFQNCDIRAVKSFRILAPRPYFLSPHIPPSHFNWLLLSKNYDTYRYKYLELDVGLIIMSQLKGKSFVQLMPRAPCEDDCDTLSFELIEGDTLVLANSLWEFEYFPGKGENVAMITETDWTE